MKPITDLRWKKFLDGGYKTWKKIYGVLGASSEPPHGEYLVFP